jgi:hypothetical protein
LYIITEERKNCLMECTAKIQGMTHESTVLTLCPNNIVLEVSPLWRGDGPMVTIKEVLAVPAVR